MQIKVRFFAVLRERAGVAEATLDLPAQATVLAAEEAISQHFPAISNDLQRVAVAVNRSFAKRDQVLRDGDELVLIPPVSGG